MKTTILKSVMMVLVALFSLNANADSVIIDGISYTLKTTRVSNEAEVVSGYSDNVKIPETIEYDGVVYTVTSIGGTYCEINSQNLLSPPRITSIEIPKTIKTVKNGAFEIVGSIGRVIITDLEAWCAIEYDGERAYNPLMWSGHLYLNDEEITDLVIPESVTEIRKSTFRGCSGITSLTIPNSVRSIGDNAFCGCSCLTSVDIPNSVTSIGEYAFAGCIGLTSLSIPNSVASIDYYAFQDCTSLTSVTIPNGITTIGMNTFSGCSGLTSVVIPSTVTDIYSYAFQDCTSLTSVTFPNSLTSIGQNAFSGCSGLTSITIPNSVTSIGISAFENCVGLKSVTIGNGVKNFCKMSFGSCYNVSDVYCHTITPPSLSEFHEIAFPGDPFKDSYIEYVTLHVPEASIDDYKASDIWKRFGEIVALTGEETRIERIVPETSVPKYVTIDGRQTPNLQKGINIIKNIDGTTKKVIVK